MVMIEEEAVEQERERVPIPIFPEEQVASDVVLATLSSLEADKITLHLGRLADADRGRLSAEQAKGLKDHRLDILRVLLAKEMVAEAAHIHKQWAGYLGTRTPENSRRYANLMFSARAVLPPAVPWEAVAYTHLNRTVPWTKQLNYDADGKPVVDVAVSVEDVTRLIRAYKGSENVAVAPET